MGQAVGGIGVEKVLLWGFSQEEAVSVLPTPFP